MTKTVKKVSVTNPQAKLYIITFNLLVMEGATPVIDQNFTCEYRPGESIDSKIKEITDKMNDVIVEYKSSQAIYNNTQLDTVVQSIQAGLVL